MLSKISIKAKLYIIVGVLFVLVTTSAFFVYTRVNRITDDKIPKQASALSMEIQILEAEGAVLGFLLYFDEEEEKNWKDNIEEYRENRVKHGSFSSTEEEERVYSRLDNTVSDFINYGNRLLEIENRIGQKDTGLISDFREYAHIIEEDVEGNDSLSAQLLEIRRREKDFLLRRDEVYISQVRLNVEEMEQMVSDPEIEEHLDSYLTAFLEVAELTLEKRELLEDFRQASSEINKIIDDEVQLITQDQIDNDSIIAEYSFWLLIFSFVFAAIILLTSAMSIIRRLDRYRQTAKVIKEGQLHERIKVEGQDELATLGLAFNDMTDKIMAERTFNKTVLESMGDGAIVLDKDMKIKAFNPTAESITGFKEKDIIGKRYSDVLRFVHDGTNRVNDDFIKKAYTEREVQYMDSNTSVLAKNKKEVPVDDSAAPLLDENGDVKGVVIIFRDVTEQRNLEKEKNTFFNIASHQLRTPLGSMRWNLESILAGDVGKISKDMKPVIESIHEQNKRLITLVNNLLDISRIEQGRQISEREEVDLVKLLKDIENDMQPLAEEANIDLQFTVDQNIPKLYVYGREMRDIIENLISNAIKYSKGEGEVSLEAMFSGNNVKISVSDTGIGIPEDDQGQIFNRFYRATNTSELNVQGTGIGLSVAKMFVEKMGGNIWFESEEGEGTVFHVILPYDNVSLENKEKEKDDKIEEVEEDKKQETKEKEDVKNNEEEIKKEEADKNKKKSKTKKESKKKPKDNKKKSKKENKSAKTKKKSKKK